LNHRHTNTVSRIKLNRIRNGIGSRSTRCIRTPYDCLRVWHNAIGVKSGPICWRCYGHCRHTHTVRTVISRATRNPTRSVIGCNLQAASSEYDRFQQADGRWAHIYDRAYIARDAAGAVWRVIGAMEDLTERSGPVARGMPLSCEPLAEKFRFCRRNRQLDIFASFSAHCRRIWVMIWSTKLTSLGLQFRHSRLG
jgi:hypothetical protein